MLDQHGWLTPCCGGVTGRKREEAANRDLFGIFRQPDKSRVRARRLEAPRCCVEASSRYRCGFHCSAEIAIWIQSFTVCYGEPCKRASPQDLACGSVSVSLLRWQTGSDGAQILSTSRIAAC